jgi:hypothetical protein
MQQKRAQHTYNARRAHSVCEKTVTIHQKGRADGVSRFI